MSESNPGDPSQSQGRAPFSRPLPTAALSSASLTCSPATALLRSEFHLNAQVSSLVEDANRNQAERRSFNPWGLYCHQAHLTRLCTEYPENKRHRILASPPHRAGHKPSNLGPRGNQISLEENSESMGKSDWESS